MSLRRRAHLCLPILRLLNCCYGGRRIRHFVYRSDAAEAAPIYVGASDVAGAACDYPVAMLPAIVIACVWCQIAVDSLSAPQGLAIMSLRQRAHLPTHPKASASQRLFRRMENPPFCLH
ncbi:hypothetical protein GW17_00056693 [Ensete ventricosum]|nr:hypothetical protein GW17_00056693 [Ensete ventricosum]